MKSKKKKKKKIQKMISMSGELIRWDKDNFTPRQFSQITDLGNILVSVFVSVKSHLVAASQDTSGLLI